MGDVLKTEQLTKIYGDTAAVDKVSLTVREGDIYGFVGKNGAGKTTFIRMVLGLAKPTSGSFSMMDGMEISQARKRTGSLVEAPAIYGNMTAEENVRLMCMVLGADMKTVPEILERVGLSNTGRKKAKNFSLGMKQRLGIALALAGDPDFLMLDEPINGLDPTGIVEIRELLLDLRNKYNKTIFISSHLLGELEKMVTRYGIISKGRLIEEITAEELSEKCGKRTRIKTDSPEKALKLIKALLKTENVETDEKNNILIADPIKNIGELTNELFKNNIVVSGISEIESSAESYFIKRMEEN